MNQSFNDIEIQNYQFLIDSHIEMIGGKKLIEKEKSELQNIEQKMKELVGELDNKTLPQKMKAILALFKIQSVQKKKIFTFVKKSLSLKELRRKANQKVTEQKILVEDLNSRLNRVQTARDKYEAILDQMEQLSSSIITGKPKKYSDYSALESFEMDDLKAELESAAERKNNSSSDTSIVKNSIEQASTAMWAANRTVQNTQKKYKQLNSKNQSANKTLEKLRKAYNLANNKFTEMGQLIDENIVPNYEQILDQIFKVADGMKLDLTQDKIQRLVPKLSAEFAQAAAESEGGNFIDSDDEYLTGGATKSRLHKHGKGVESLLKDFDKTFKNYEGKSSQRNKTLISNLNTFGKILSRLANVSDLVKTYIEDSQRLQELAGEAAIKVTAALDEWKRTTQDNVNKERKKILQEREGQKQQPQESEGGYFFW
jgi:hypothetical protein